MALPLNTISTTAVESALVPPDDRERVDYTQDFEKGGTHLNDPSNGLNERDWRVFTDGVSVWVESEDNEFPPALQFTGADITEVSLAFDQNMQPTIAFVEGGVTKLRWYDPTLPGMTTTTFSGAVGPMVTLDDKRDIAVQLGMSDVILAYIRAGNAYYRQQRDRFLTEYLLGAVPSYDSARITQLGMGVNGRLQFKIKYPPTAKHVDLLTDTAYIVSGQDVVAIGDGEVQSAVWRSKTYQFHEQPSPGWARLEGDYPARIRVIGDGAPFYTTPEINGPDPVRLPSKRWREWALEVVGATRVVAVSAADTREDLV